MVAYKLRAAGGWFPAAGGSFTEIDVCN